MKYSAYAPSKPSDVEWLGNVPQDWIVKSIKRETPVLRGASPRPIDDPKYFDDDGEFAWVRISDVTSAGMYLRKTEQRLSDIGSALSVKLEPGALFLSIAGSVGKPCISAIRCCIHDGFVYFPRWKGDVRFLYYIFASGEPYRGLGKLGTQLNLNTDTVGAINIAMPASNEQRAVADFLDRETARLDTLVGKKRELIEKLKEKRTALISRTVTRGLPAEAAAKASLNTHPKLKPSGVEWLGDIPKHWEVKRIKHVAFIRYGLGEPPEYVTDGVPFIRATDIKRGEIEMGAVRRVDRGNIPWSRRPELGEGEILVVRSGAYTGDSAIVTRDVVGCIAGYDMVLTATKAFPRFLAWVLLSKYMLEGQIHLSRLRAAQPHLNAEELGGFIFVAPPLEEQGVIADYLNSETTKLDKMMEKVESAIEKLQEYRTALITAAVTGKIDVRNAVK